ncbi:MAG: arginine--tRNA ligase [archaeon]|nr:arginine--tRNA ligase [archaeon]
MKQLIVNSLGNYLPLKKEEIENLIEIPPSPEFGDYSFPCFSLAKILKKNPNQIAEELKNKIKTGDNIERIEVKGAYLNFFVNKNKLIEKIVKEILEKKGNYGKANIKKQNIMIEFSQPNTHKAFHVGHIRGTSIGESISRISEFFGEKVIRANYSGDTGMHIAKWIWCYKKYHSKEKLRNDESWIASIYVDAVKRITNNPKFQDEVDEINKKLEEKEDKKLQDLWKKTRKLSIDSWGKIYSQLNTKFDVHYFESEVEKKAKEISLRLLKQGIAEKSEGAVIMNLEKYNLGVWVLLRSDQTVLYSAKDLALIEKKSNDYKLDKSLNIVGNEQDLHFKQLFKTLELIDFKHRKKFSYITFGMVRLPTGKMSSRTGDNILYSDFIEEITNHAKQNIKKRSPKISKQELEKRALIIAIAAIKFSMLKQSPDKDIIFQKEEALDFEGDTGPYIQYSYARASSILKKSGKKIKKDFKIKNLDEKEIEIAKKLSEFPEIVSNSYKNLNPAHIANYSYQLAKIFNEFYHACPVINSENEDFRLALVESFRYVIKNSMNLLGIDVLEKM